MGSNPSSSAQKSRVNELASSPPSLTASMLQSASGVGREPSSIAGVRLFSRESFLVKWVTLWLVRRRVWLRTALALSMAALSLLSASPARAQDNLLQLKEPSRVEGVRNVKVLTDGRRAVEGDEWNTNLTAVFESGRSLVEYKLDKGVDIDAVYLQGDNNDRYRVSVSQDGKSFRQLWEAPDVREPGLRGRFTTGLKGQATYVRIEVRGGDGAYSLSEVQLFKKAPTPFPPALPEGRGMAQGPFLRGAILLFVLAFAAFVFATERRTSPAWLIGAAAAPVAASYWMFEAMDRVWPVGGREVSLLRAAAAALALLVLLREAWLRRRFPPNPTATVGTLLVSATLAFGAFYNLGHPQFWNHKEARPEFVHTWDMRVYYPFAKYFEEVHYDGVYLASVAAYVDSVPGTTLSSVDHTEIRNLKNHRTQHVRDVHAEVEEVKKRFSPGRWESFKEDMTYFRDVMGPEYMATHHDHGSNATPVWVACARLVFAGGPASEGRLVFGGLVDALLLLGTFFAIWRSFGVRAMCLCMVVFGANDFYMFGTNWGGATLRHDWLAYLGLGVCALRKERWILGGVLFGMSTMIRAFPGAALIGVTLTVLWWLAETWRKDRKLPAPKTIWREQTPALKVLAGAAGFMLFSFLATAIWFGFGVWVEWWEKVMRLNSELGLNDVSLRSLIAGSDGLAAGPWRARRIVFTVASVVAVGAVVWACRRRRLDQAVLLSLPLISILANPANYYAHYIYLLPLLATRRTGMPKEIATAGTIPMKLPVLAAAAPLLAVCIAQYWTVLDTDLERHFQAATALLFVGLIFVFKGVLERTPLPTDQNTEEQPEPAEA